ncbi:MAG: branched-chain amino acid ABC transporter permease [Gaiellaceae bacterium]
MSRRSVALELLGPAALVALVGIVGAFTSNATAIYFQSALVSVAIVVALYVFVGNSGVLSFGQVSFAALGAYAAGIMSAPVDSKAGTLPDAFPLLRDHAVGNAASFAIATAVGAVFALVAGVALMRLSGLAAGIATFAVLEITHNILQQWTKIGPGAGTLSSIPETSGMLQVTIGALGVVAIAFGYQRTRFGRQLRATREDPAAAQAVGISVHRQRLWAFALSGGLSGSAGALYVHQIGTLSANDLYLELTFLSLAMLVVGGATSLWGAVLGALAISGFNSFLGQAESGVNIGFTLDLPTGTRLVAVGAVMALILVVRPSGITGGREFSFDSLGRLSRHRRRKESTA